MSRVTLRGCDGSVWELLDRKSPVQLAEGLSGLHLPPVTHRYSKNARRAGGRWRGSVTDSRRFRMNIFVGDPRTPYRRGDAWRDLDGQFWEALSTEETADLVIEGQRTLTFRLDEGNSDFEFPEDPARLGRAVYPIACIADFPYYVGETQTTLFTFDGEQAQPDYYGGAGGTGYGPPYVIASSLAAETAAVNVPGDLEPWPTYTITGPSPAVRIGVGGHVIALPFALQQGDTVIVDTEAETISDQQGNDLWPLMGYTPVDFAPLPHGESVPVLLAMDTPGEGASIAVTVTPLYRRAWGRGGAAELAPSVSPGNNGALGTSPLGTSPLGGTA